MPNMLALSVGCIRTFLLMQKSRLALLQTGKRAHDTELLFQILIQVPQANFILRLMNTTERLWSWCHRRSFRATLTNSDYYG